MAEKIRLQKFFSDMGLMSRRAAEEEIARGHITVNGHVAALGTKIDAYRDIVAWKGKRIELKKEEPVYIMINKPRGYLCAVSDDRGRRCVVDLIEGVDARVYPVGRLDLISEGILILTNDGELTQRMTHPSHELAKVYRVKVDGSVSDSQLEQLNSPMVIDEYTIKPAEVTVHSIYDDATTLSFTLKEGRNRQIRKMCENVGLRVKRLNRVSIGKLKLGGLAVGKWRHLEPEEVQYLYRATEGRKSK